MKHQIKSALANNHSRVLRMERITKCFGQRIAVDALSLDIRQGEVVGLLGPNGSGKTTTLLMALGLITPTTGDVELFGHRITDLSQRQVALRRVGSLIENPVFYPYLSGRENLCAVALLSGWNNASIIATEVDRVLSEVDLTKRANDLFKKYSLGMKQRLGIAAGLLTHPDLLILDEPTNGLDPAGIVEIRSLIATIAQQGTTVLLSSHLLHEVQQICSRVVILKEGHLLADRYVQELLQHSGMIYISFRNSDVLENARHVLALEASQDASWLQDLVSVSSQEEIWKQLGGYVLQVRAPFARSDDLCALLSNQGIYLTELRRCDLSLEQFFFSLMNQPSSFPIHKEVVPCL